MFSLSLSLSVNLGLYPLTSLTTCYRVGALLIILAVSYVPVCDFEPFVKSLVLIAGDTDTSKIGQHLLQSAATSIPLWAGPHLHPEHLDGRNQFNGFRPSFHTIVIYMSSCTWSGQRLERDAPPGSATSDLIGSAMFYSADGLNGKKEGGIVDNWKSKADELFYI